MKKYIKINILIPVLIIVLQQYVVAQFSCNVEYHPNSKIIVPESKLILPANIGELKTIRVIVHLPLRTDGTGNFTESTDYYGVANEFTGYWFAELFIERSNMWLNLNEEMTQQLSYETIPINDINLNYELAGVIFHRDDVLYNTSSLFTMDNYVDSFNRDIAINIFLYPQSWGNGAAFFGYDVCWCNGVKKAYDDYLSYGDWGIDNGVVHVATHEIGHCLELEHAKRYGGGDCCFDDNPFCLDDCDDTPTYLELLNDGHSEPCAWGVSNNIMDYSSVQRAWTLCQIEIIHSTIEAGRQILYPCGYVINDLHINSNISFKNKSYVAKNITISGVTVSQNKALYIYCESFETTGEFQLENGASLEINTAPKCN